MSGVIEALVEREYAFGFHSVLDTDLTSKGLNGDMVSRSTRLVDPPHRQSAIYDDHDVGASLISLHPPWFITHGEPGVP